MEGIDTMSKRWAYKAVIQKYANESAGRGKFSAKRLAAMFTGATVYEVQTREQSLFRSDKDKSLKDRLTWDRIASAGFVKAGVSSIRITVALAR